MSERFPYYGANDTEQDDRLEELKNSQAEHKSTALFTAFVSECGTKTLC